MKRTAVLGTGCCAWLILSLLFSAEWCLAGGYEFKMASKQEAVLAFAVDSGKTGSIRGSGFLMDDLGHLLTTCEVLIDNVSVKAYGGGRYSIKKVVARDETLNLAKALLDMPKDRPPRLDISEALPTLGERLVVLGSEDGEDRVVSEGLVSGIHFMPDGRKLIEMTAPVQQGCCGGPVINMRGQVIGVSSPQAMGGKTAHLVIPIRYAKELGTRNNFPWQWSKRRAGEVKAMSNIVPIDWSR